MRICATLPLLTQLASKSSCKPSHDCLWYADFASAPNLTAAAAAQNLAWAPVSVQSPSLLSYSLSYNATAASAVLSLAMTAELGVSGSITDVVPAYTSSSRRSLLAASPSEQSAVLFVFQDFSWICNPAQLLLEWHTCILLDKLQAHMCAVVKPC